MDKTEPVLLKDEVGIKDRDLVERKALGHQEEMKRFHGVCDVGKTVRVHQVEERKYDEILVYELVH